MTQKEARTRREIGGEIEVQEGVKRDLEMQIINAKIQLQELKKQSKMTQASATQQAAASTKKKYGQNNTDEEPEANIDLLMDDIRKDIINVYKVIGDPNVLDAKQTIEVLQDIEINLNEYMKVIKYIHDENEGYAREVGKQEHKRKDYKTEEQKKERERQDRDN